LILTSGLLAMLTDSHMRQKAPAHIAFFAQQQRRVILADI